MTTHGEMMSESEDGPRAPRTKDSSTADKLALISEQRTALKEVVKISLAISRLQDGLQSVLLLGKSTSNIPSSYLKKFDALRASINNEPSNKLERSLGILEKYINSAVQKLIDIVDQGERSLDEHDSSAAALDDIHKDIQHELDDFRRKSQTAVVIRLLLRERGVTTEALSLAVPEETIVSKLTKLDSKEKKYRKRIQTEIVVMDKHITTILADPNIPDPLKMEMQSIKDSLLKNLAHLYAGKPLEDLPIVFEIIEMGTEEDYKYAFKPTSLPIAEPVDAAPEQVTKPKRKIKRSFIARFIEWVSTPPSVGWKDIDKYKNYRK